MLGEGRGRDRWSAWRGGWAAAQLAVGASSVGTGGREGACTLWLLSGVRVWKTAPPSDGRCIYKDREKRGCEGGRAEASESGNLTHPCRASTDAVLCFTVLCCVPHRALPCLSGTVTKATLDPKFISNAVTQSNGEITLWRRAQAGFRRHAIDHMPSKEVGDGIQGGRGPGRASGRRPGGW